MNLVFKSFFHQFVLVLFNDILVYRQSWSDHLDHLQKVFEALCNTHWWLNVSIANLVGPLLSILTILILLGDFKWTRIRCMLLFLSYTYDRE